MLSAILAKNFVVIFNGYGNDPCTEGEQHRRRVQKSSPDIVSDERKPAYHNQNAFLANECNKKYFVEFLISCFRSAGYLVKQAHDDADCLIVHMILDVAQSCQVT